MRQDNKLTWADVKVGWVCVNDQPPQTCKLKTSKDGHALFTDGTTCIKHESGKETRILGRFDEIGCKLDYDNGGFTVPDEVLNPKPVGKPASEFKEGEGFKLNHGVPMLRVSGGIIGLTLDGKPCVAADCELKTLGIYQDCTPCDPPFKIVKEGDGKVVMTEDELAGLLKIEYARGHDAACTSGWVKENKDTALLDKLLSGSGCIKLTDGRINKDHTSSTPIRTREDIDKMMGEDANVNPFPPFGDVKNTIDSKTYITDPPEQSPPSQAVRDLVEYLDIACRESELIAEIKGFAKHMQCQVGNQILKDKIQRVQAEIEQADKGGE